MKSRTSVMKKTILAAAAIAALRALNRRRRSFDYRGKSVLVTGGVRGLGLEISRLLLDRGAKVAICSRTQTDIDIAVEELSTKHDGRVLGFTCDVSNETAVHDMVGSITAVWGGVDILMNVAGVITVGPIEAMTRDDFLEAMDCHFWGPYNTMEAVLPLMRQRKWGRIVNVASMGGKRAVPHMVPYDASKFALQGLSMGYRNELRKDHIFVTTVCPSLMNTGSPRNAWVKGQAEKEYTWFAVADALPLLSLPSRDAALKILSACQYGDAELVLPRFSRIGVALSELMPDLMSDALTLMARLLPSMGGQGKLASRGYMRETAITRSPITKLGREAAVRNNEMGTNAIL